MRKFNDEGLKYICEMMGKIDSTYPTEEETGDEENAVAQNEVEPEDNTADTNQELDIQPHGEFEKAEVVNEEIERDNKLLDEAVAKIKSYSEFVANGMLTEKKTKYDEAENILSSVINEASNFTIYSITNTINDIINGNKTKATYTNVRNFLNTIFVIDENGIQNQEVFNQWCNIFEDVSIFGYNLTDKETTVGTFYEDLINASNQIQIKVSELNKGIETLLSLIESAKRECENNNVSPRLFINGDKNGLLEEIKSTEEYDPDDSKFITNKSRTDYNDLINVSEESKNNIDTQIRTILSVCASWGGESNTILTWDGFFKKANINFDKKLPGAFKTIVNLFYIIKDAQYSPFAEIIALSKILIQFVASSKDVIFYDFDEPNKNILPNYDINKVSGIDKLKNKETLNEESYRDEDLSELVSMLSGGFNKISGVDVTAIRAYDKVYIKNARTKLQMLINLRLLLKKKAVGDRLDFTNSFINNAKEFPNTSAFVYAFTGIESGGEYCHALYDENIRKVFFDKANAGNTKSILYDVKGKLFTLDLNDEEQSGEINEGNGAQSVPQIFKYNIDFDNPFNKEYQLALDTLFNLTSNLTDAINIFNDEIKNIRIDNDDETDRANQIDYLNNGVKEFIAKKNIAWKKNQFNSDYERFYLLLNLLRKSEYDNKRAFDTNSSSNIFTRIKTGDDIRNEFFKRMQLKFNILAKMNSLGLPAELQDIITSDVKKNDGTETTFSGFTKILEEKRDEFSDEENAILDDFLIQLDKYSSGIDKINEMPCIDVLSGLFASTELTRNGAQEKIHNFFETNLGNDYLIEDEVNRYQKNKVDEKLKRELGNKSFDFKITKKDSDLDLYIEYQGEQHYLPRELTKYEPNSVRNEKWYKIISFLIKYIGSASNSKTELKNVLLKSLNVINKSISTHLNEDISSNIKKIEYLDSPKRWEHEIDTLLQQASDKDKFIKVNGKPFNGKTSKVIYLRPVTIDPYCTKEDIKYTPGWPNSKDAVANAVNIPFMTSFSGSDAYGLKNGITNESIEEQMYYNTYRYGVRVDKKGNGDSQTRTKSVDIIKGIFENHDQQQNEMQLNEQIQFFKRIMGEYDKYYRNGKFLDD